jgi:hypothetical protein
MQTARPGVTSVPEATVLRAEFDFYEPGPGRPGENDADDDVEDFEQDDFESDDVDGDHELVRELIVPEEHPLDDE